MCTFVLKWSPTPKGKNVISVIEQVVWEDNFLITRCQFEVSENKSCSPILPFLTRLVHLNEGNDTNRV